MNTERRASIFGLQQFNGATPFDICIPELRLDEPIDGD